MYSLSTESFAFCSYANYLHPEKRNIAGATNTISNPALKITSVVESRLSDIF